MYKIKILLSAVMLLDMAVVVEAGPPLPLHTIEGNSGVFITSTAYLANPPENGDIFGKPSVSTSAVFAKEKDLQSFAVTQKIYSRFEIGYAYERFGLGDWPDDVKTAAGASVSQHLGLHNVNLRAMIVEEDSFDYSWMPGVTFGTHLKWNEGQTKLDDDLGGLMDTLGSDHSRGVEFTLVASKTITDGYTDLPLLPRSRLLKVRPNRRQVWKRHPAVSKRWLL
jgi:hypothetical protein